MERTVTRRMVLGLGGAALVGSIAGCLDRGSEGERVEVDPGTRVVLDGYTTHWEGVEPDTLAGEENPTLVLTDGEPYEIEWINADGFGHDLQIWDDEENVVDDLATEEIDSEDDGATLEFTADERMETYVCTLHQQRQRGSIEVE